MKNKALTKKEKQRQEEIIKLGFVVAEWLKEHSNEDSDLAKDIMGIHSTVLMVLVSYVDVEVHGDEHTMQTVWADLFENTAMMRRDWEEFTQAEPDRFTKNQTDKIQ
tara:strand:+ start:1748 stop:2068 length:321 start_codon:yes stop_codon:yes gene_type:complete